MAMCMTRMAQVMYPTEQEAIKKGVDKQRTEQSKRGNGTGQVRVTMDVSVSDSMAQQVEEKLKKEAYQ